MNDRDRLIELLTDNLPRCGNLPHWDNPLQLSCDEQVERIADHLLANGVIIPPCKVGDTVYCIEYNLMLVDEYTVDGYTFKNSKLALYVRSGIYSTVVSEWYLTKEEAERVLKEREQNG